MGENRLVTWRHVWIASFNPPGSSLRSFLLALLLRILKRQPSFESLMFLVIALKTAQSTGGKTIKCNELKLVKIKLLPEFTNDSGREWDVSTQETPKPRFREEVFRELLSKICFLGA